MKVILFNVFGYPVHSYGLVVACSLLLAYGVAIVLTKGTVYQQHLSSFILYAIIGALICARIWHVFFFQWPYYSQHPGEILAIWNGGISILGAIVGGAIAMVIYTRRHKLDVWEMADYLAPAVVLGQGLGRIACLLNGDAFGSPTGSTFGLVYPPGTMAYEQYGSTPLWPAEVWEGQGDFVIFALLLIMSGRRPPKGWIILSYVILYSFLRFMLEFLRGDSPRYLFDWTAGQWTTFPTMVVAVLVGLYLYVRQQVASRKAAE
jgi:phosphatidylglycerol:prolipoprotein diacylglycerol transferase